MWFQWTYMELNMLCWETFLLRDLERKPGTGISENMWQAAWTSNGAQFNHVLRNVKEMSSWCTLMIYSLQEAESSGLRNFFQQCNKSSVWATNCLVEQEPRSISWSEDLWCWVMEWWLCQELQQQRWLNVLRNTLVMRVCRRYPVIKLCNKKTMRKSFQQQMQRNTRVW